MVTHITASLISTNHSLAPTCYWSHHCPPCFSSKWRCCVWWGRHSACTLNAHWRNSHKDTLATIHDNRAKQVQPEVDAEVHRCASDVLGRPGRNASCSNPRNANRDEGHWGASCDSMQCTTRQPGQVDKARIIASRNHTGYP